MMDIYIIKFVNMYPHAFSKVAKLQIAFVFLPKEGEILVNKV